VATFRARAPPPSPGRRRSRRPVERAHPRQRARRPAVGSSRSGVDSVVPRPAPSSRLRWSILATRRGAARSYNGHPLRLPRFVASLVSAAPREVLRPPTPRSSEQDRRSNQVGIRAVPRGRHRPAAWVLSTIEVRLVDDSNGNGREDPGERRAPRCTSPVDTQSYQTDVFLPPQADAP
jgi:hypothetical protein